MEFSIKLYTIKSRWSIISTEGSQVIISKNYRFSFFKIDFVLANSTDCDEMPQNVAFHLGLHRLMKYPFMAFQSAKGLIRPINYTFFSYLCLLYLAVFFHTVVVTSPLEDCRQTAIYWDHEGLLFVGGNTGSSDSDVMIPRKRNV